MNILALHLPQFHTIPENDLWWGPGFTEWSNVRKAKPLYIGHTQPMVPLDHYYYDLSKKEDIIWQTKLANSYGVHGFIYYHYWFNGKKLLEKPCNILLRSEEIKINYCFCWANLPWTRTWNNKDSDILMPQTYGGEADWKTHLEFLMPFFQDKRYIKKDGKPLFFVYSPRGVQDFDEMVEYWNKILIKSGFNGIYIVEYISPANPNAFSRYSQAVMEFEPLYTARYGVSAYTLFRRVMWKKLKHTEHLDYDQIWKGILSRRRVYGEREIIKGAFCAWDNTPRRGKAGAIFHNSSASKFQEYLLELVKQNRLFSSKDFIVINAWNEWGEGAMLEPTEQFGYAYLEAVKAVNDIINSKSNQYSK